MIQKLINPSKTSDMLFLTGVVLNIMNERVYADEEKSLLPELFSVFGLETTVNLVKYFGGESLSIPSHEEMEKSFLVLVCYYKKKVEDKDWDTIREEVGIDINPHALGKLVQSIDSRIKLEVEDMKEMGIDKVMQNLAGKRD